jgi:hypothetical protein
MRDERRGEVTLLAGRTRNLHGARFPLNPSNAAFTSAHSESKVPVATREIIIVFTSTGYT